MNNKERAFILFWFVFFFHKKNKNQIFFSNLRNYHFLKKISLFSLNMQSQKFTAVVESMQRGETLVALKTISTLTSKEKNKAKLSENELKLIHVLKALCLSKMHEYGESHSLIMNFLKNEKNVMFSEGNVIHWLDYIASGLHLYKDVREFSGNLYNKAGNKEEHLIEYMNLCVKEYNHHEVFSSALRLYKLTNNVKYMFINVIYQYRSILNTAEVVELPKKLEIVYLFTEKLMKDLKIDTEKKNEFEKIHHQAVNFALTLCKKQQKHQKALEILDKYQWAFEDFRESIGHFSEINSFVKTEDSRLALINKYYSKFQKDQNLDKLVMQFELYEKFIDFLFEEIKDFQYPEGFFENLTQTENYKDSEYFKPLKGNITNNDLLLDFFSNLAGLKHDTNLQKNHKNYKSALQIFISAKILLLLKSLKYLKDDNETQRNMIFPYYHRLLEEYIDNFSTTFTFSEEFQVLIKDMPILTLETAFNQIENTQKDQKLPNRYIREVSLMKLRLCNGLGETAYTLKGVLALVKQALRLYEQGFLDLELENKYLEKGERHFIDDFLIIAADVVLVYIFNFTIFIFLRLVDIFLNF